MERAYYIYYCNNQIPEPDRLPETDTSDCYRKIPPVFLSLNTGSNNVNCLFKATGLDLGLIIIINLVYIFLCKCVMFTNNDLLCKFLSH